ncbi:dynein regulatory complex protein 9-like [Littorina saxatilis]|uniref:dynein regulatory complex protein 9-like n=1 Tax=Littorina saxatilis TaxID=31220 RepID=UPI0038B46DF1
MSTMEERLLRAVDAIHCATVFEDCVDQLAILGRIMPASFEFRPDAQEIVRSEIDQLVDGQQQLENKFQSALETKAALNSKTKNSAKLRAASEGVNTIGGDLKNSTHVFGRSLRQNPLTTDNIQKIQDDRGFVEVVMTSTMAELAQNRSFETLVKAVRAAKQRKASLQMTIQKEEDGRKRVKQLQKQIQDVKVEKESELQQRNEMISHLKDQLQEMKAKSNMEGKYIKKCAEVAVAQTQKRCMLSEKELKDEAEKLTNKIDEENRANAEIESYLRAHVSDLTKKQEYWMEKFEKDKDAKQHELDVLKASKANDLARLQELTKLYKEYEQVVVEDRIEKEKVRRKEEQEGIELRACIKLQAWWRGVMVRKGFGAFAKKKKGKKGKGKKGKGKKKK